jgi:hypothetical protein
MDCFVTRCTLKVHEAWCRTKYTGMPPGMRAPLFPIVPQGTGPASLPPPGGAPPLFPIVPAQQAQPQLQAPGEGQPNEQLYPPGEGPPPGVSQQPSFPPQGQGQPQNLQPGPSGPGIDAPGPHTGGGVPGHLQQVSGHQGPGQDLAGPHGPQAVPGPLGGQPAPQQQGLPQPNSILPGGPIQLPRPGQVLQVGPGVPQGPQHAIPSSQGLPQQFPPGQGGPQQFPGGTGTQPEGPNQFPGNQNMPPGQGHIGSGGERGPIQQHPHMPVPGQGPLGPGQPGGPQPLFPIAQRGPNGMEQPHGQVPQYQHPSQSGGPVFPGGPGGQAAMGQGPPPLFPIAQGPPGGAPGPQRPPQLFPIAQGPGPVGAPQHFQQGWPCPLILCVFDVSWYKCRCTPRQLDRWRDKKMRKGDELRLLHHTSYLPVWQPVRPSISEIMVRVGFQFIISVSFSRGEKGITDCMCFHLPTADCSSRACSCGYSVASTKALL